MLAADGYPHGVLLGSSNVLELFEMTLTVTCHMIFTMSHASVQGLRENRTEEGTPHVVGVHVEWQRASPE